MFSGVPFEQRLHEVFEAVVAAVGAGPDASGGGVIHIGSGSGRALHRRREAVQQRLRGVSVHSPWRAVAGGHPRSQTLPPTLSRRIHQESPTSPPASDAARQLGFKDEGVWRTPTAQTYHQKEPRQSLTRLANPSAASSAPQLNRTSTKAPTKLQLRPPQRRGPRRRPPKASLYSKPTACTEFLRSPE